MGVTIIGAGLAGLLAGNMLRNSQIVEKQSELPNNHSAVLRFRSSIVGDTLGIPFNRVKMIKAVSPWLNPVADTLAYSFKNTGQYRSDRSITDGLVVADRWVAPPDLILRMSNNMSITYDAEANPLFFTEELKRYACISTMPMPALMKLLQYPYIADVEFKFEEATHIRAEIADCDAYVSILFPNPVLAYSRVSITKNEIIVEVPKHAIYSSMNIKQIMEEASYELGIPRDKISNVTATQSKYAKIVPISEDIRKDFIFWATDKHNIFSLGRFATWRPNLLLDDLVKDIRLIEGWMDRRQRYNVARHR